MTPKKILSIPVYGTGLTLGWLGLLLILPGGLLILAGLGLAWLADKLSAEDQDYPTCDLTIKEFEEGVDIGTDQTCDNCVYGDACLQPSDGWCDQWWGEENING
jgi:hypothetical protein